MHFHRNPFNTFIPRVMGLSFLLLFILFIWFPVKSTGQTSTGSAAPAPHAPSSISTITGPTTACAGVGGYTYTTESGMFNYVWTVSSGGTITYGSGTNSITVTWNSAGSETVMVTYTGASTPATLNVSVLSILPVGVTISATSNPVCSGTLVTFTASPSNGGSSPVYQWKVNSIVVGTNSSNLTYIPANGDIVTCQITSDLPCVTGNPATSAPVVMTVNPNLPVSIFISASANPVCQGNPVVFTANQSNGGATPVFQWKVNGIIGGTNNPVFSYSPSNADVVTCQVTSSLTCASGNPATSSPVIMTVSPSQVVSVTVSASANPSCQGNPVTYTATPVNGGTSPAYQWTVNGSNAGSNNPVFTYIPVNGDQVSCQLTSNAACSTGNPAISNVIPMTVMQSLPASISITSSSNPVCQGTQVTFTAIPVMAERHLHINGRSMVLTSG